MQPSHLLSLLALSVLGACASVTTPPTAGATLLAGNAYVFRGVPQVTHGVLQGDVHAAVTDEAGATYSFMAWANMNLSEDGDDGVFAGGNGNKVAELDLIPEYSRKYEAWTFAAGAVNYNFPNGVGTSTTEGYVSAGHTSMLNPKLTVYYDFEEVDGFYAMAAISHAWTVAKDVTLDAGLSLGFADENQGEIYWFDKSSGLADLVGKVGVAYAWSPHVSLTAAVYGSTILSDDYRDALDANNLDSDNFWFLLGSAWSF